MVASQHWVNICLLAQIFVAHLGLAKDKTPCRKAGTTKDWTVLLCSAAAVGQPTGTAGRAGLVEGAATAWGKSHLPIVGVTAGVLPDFLEWQDAKIRERLGLWRRNRDDRVSIRTSGSSRVALFLQFRQLLGFLPEKEREEETEVSGH